MVASHKQGMRMMISIIVSVMFLDLPTHLRSIPTNDLEKLVGELLHTTDRMSRAQDVIYRLLDGATAK